MIVDMLNQYWEQSSSVAHWNEGVTQIDLGRKLAWIDVLRRNLPTDRRRLRILDVATGTGLFALLAAELGHQVTGLDASAAMLQQARANARNWAVRCDFVLGDAMAIEFGDETFDAVIGRFALSSMGKPVTALREWGRVLKPAGRLLLVEDDANSDRNSRFKSHFMHTRFGVTPAYGKAYEELTVQNGESTPPVELTNLITRSGLTLLTAGHLSGQLQQQVEWNRITVQRPYLIVVAEKAAKGQKYSAR
jgi:ubiquinone/menaquinone biosynthesis C-methylase UbiE